MSSLPSNFHAKTKPADCIVWTGALNSRGYPCFAVGGVSQLAHRLAYEDAHGPIPEGFTVDHLCGFRRCVNPEHLEAVTVAENIRRAKELSRICQYGHPLGGIDSRGCRYCTECSRERARQDYAKKSKGAGGATSTEVRAWAKRNGIPVNARGNLPNAVRAAYEAAHPQALSA